jgi:hypothetical protein
MGKFRREYPRMVVMLGLRSEELFMRHVKFRDEWQG